MGYVIKLCAIILLTPFAVALLGFLLILAVGYFW